VEVGVPWPGVEAQAKAWPRLDTPVLNATQAHAGQQFTDEIGRKGERI